MQYNLEHLTQDVDQTLLGPIQDDEALLLFSIIKTMRLKNIIEIGGLSGYSAKNFLAAVDTGKVYTIDINPVKKISQNHIVIEKDCRYITRDDISENIDLIFFDAHVYDEQIIFFNALREHQLIDDNVVLAFHDTNLHPRKICESYYIESEKGWCHQPVERKLVNYFKGLNFDAICFHTTMDESSISFRHGITIMKKFKHLAT
jgi:hypothetical protein